MALGNTTMLRTAWNTLTTSTAQQWYNPDKARDVISKATPFLFWQLQNAKEKEMGESIAIRLLDVRNTVTPYSYYDALPTTPIKGSTAAQVQVAQYNSPLAISEQELLELTTADAMVDRYKMLVRQTEMGYGYRLSIDQFGGNVVDSKRMAGLEQIYAPYTQLAATGSSAATTLTSNYTAEKWRLRQAANVYAGITRVAFTADEVAGTNFENVSVNFFDGVPGYTTSAPYPPNDALIAMQMVKDAASYGAMAPKIMVSSPKVFADYRNAAMTKTTIWKTAEAHSGAELAYSAMMFDGLLWLSDEYCKIWNTAGNATAGDLCFYMLHAGGDDGTHVVQIDPRLNFSITDTRIPVDQHAGVQHMQLRIQQFSESPRNGAVGFNISA